MLPSINFHCRPLTLIFTSSSEGSIKQEVKPVDIYSNYAIGLTGHSKQVKTTKKVIVINL